jgi:hypothetical protein
MRAFSISEVPWLIISEWPWIIKKESERVFSWWIIKYESD